MCLGAIPPGPQGPGYMENFPYRSPTAAPGSWDQRPRVDIDVGDPDLPLRHRKRRFCSFVGTDVPIAPTAYTVGALVLKTEAQVWDRKTYNFSPAQGPSGPERNGDARTDLHAPEVALSVTGVTPVMGVQGVSEYEREALILSSPLGASQGELPRRGKRGWPGPLASFWASRKKLAARRRRNSPAFKKDPAFPAPPGPVWTARHSCSASP